jgi:iron(III) transport system substrate-binding protein
MSKPIASIVAVIGLLLATAAGGFAQGAKVRALTGTSDWNQVIAAAKKEGAVTMYCNPGTETALEAAAAVFEKTYGIKVTLSDADGATNAQKVLIEAQTGRVAGDVYFAGLGPVNTLAKAGYAVALDPPNQANVVPAFAGKLVMQDPRVDGGGGTFFVSTFDKLGPSFETALAAQHPLINGAGGGSAAEEAVARGDYTIMIAGRAHAIEAYPQAPLRWIGPSEGAVVVPIAMTMVKGAPHPNAARLWANYLLRPEVQANLSTTVMPVIKNPTLKNPLFRLKLKFLEVLPPSQDRSKYYADAKQLYGAQ